MQLVIQTTKDGSHTLFSEQFDEIYHSRHGAWQESQHVFIEAGLMPLLEKSPKLHVLEIGFGTGLNAILTLEKAVSTEKIMHYIGIEAFPVDEAIIKALNYKDFWKNEVLENYFIDIHRAEWNLWKTIHPHFSLLKIHATLQLYESPSAWADLVYFDAFAPSKQPEMWEKAIFEKIFQLLNIGGVMVTYCSKGAVQRTLKSVGFQVEKLPGPKGKREMIKAIKIVR